jgi:hypothetical protein
LNERAFIVGHPIWLRSLVHFYYGVSANLP